ncbi:MAG: NAD-dependent epimerase/dehydratase family protein [Chloroflexi bacterium]|nr:NAD-dependent epimerase/dehydratase family protein [Chloroflexota bacterium]
MRILIIGGTGLISTAITRELVARGEDVTLYNRGQRQASLPDGPTRLYGDRSDYPAFEQQMAAQGTWDCVIDMVAFLPQDVESAIRAFSGRTAQYIFCSTVDVYTKPAKTYPITEDAERQPKPSFPYALNKARCERLLETAFARGDLPVTLIRPAHTYGEGGRLVHTFGFETYFLDRLRRGLPLIVHGDGRSLWSSCHRDDVGRAFANAVGNEDTLGRAYHLTGEEWLTWDRYYQSIAEGMGWPTPQLVHIPTDLLGRAEPERAWWCVENFSFNNIFDNARARRELGFRYTIPWVEGSRRCATWLIEHGQIASADDHPFYDKLLHAWERLSASLVADMRS